MVDQSRPKYSVILPAHNRSDVIGYAIESVLYQTENDFELLIAGDGCTDNTEEVVNRYSHEKRLQWFDFPKTEGYGYANKNKAFKKATGQYIAFMAHDDIWFPDHLEKLGKILNTNGEVDLVYSRPLWVDETGLMLPSAFNLDNPSAIEFFLNAENTIPASNFLYRQSLFEKIGYWDETLPESADWDFWKRAIRSSPHRNYYFETQPTIFHFKANWKTIPAWPVGLTELVRLMKKKQDVLPSPFLVPISEKKTEQEVFWQKIKWQEGWLNSIRKAIPDFFDHLIQTELTNLVQRSPELTPKPSFLFRVKRKLRMLLRGS